MSRARDLADLGGSADAGTVTGESLIINGDMAVSQRGSVPAIQTDYTACDRFAISGSGTAARFDSSQSTDVPSGQGFSNSLKLDVSTADTSISAGDFALLYQNIEAQNLQHLKYGTSSAEKCTLSFWVKSPKTGIHIVEVFHVDASYGNSHQYNITTADTWQKVEVTFDGYQTTAIDNDKEAGFTISFWLVAGSNYSDGTFTENTWGNTDANRAVGQVNIADSTSNDFYLTGVKLEVGTVATPYRHESYEENLAKCQRYYQRVIGQNTASGVMAGASFNNTTHYFVYHHPVSMRSTATIGRSALADFIVVGTGTSKGATGFSRSGGSTETSEITVNSAALGAAGGAVWLRINAADKWIEFKAEL